MRLHAYLESKKVENNLKHKVLDEATRNQDEWFNKNLSEARAAEKQKPIATPARANTDAAASQPQQTEENPNTALAPGLPVQPEAAETPPEQTLEQDTLDYLLTLGIESPPPMTEGPNQDEAAPAANVPTDPEQNQPEQQPQPEASAVEVVEDCGDTSLG